MAEKHIVCPADELPVGERRIIEVGGKSIGVFNVEGTYHAIRNVCPHQMAPLCLGKITGTASATDRVGDYRWERQGRIITRPWHGWEFDITTGQSVFNPHRCRVKHYDVTVEDAGQNTGQDADDMPDEAEPDPGVETYHVTVEQQMVVLHLYYESHLIRGVGIIVHPRSPGALRGRARW